MDAGDVFLLMIPFISPPKKKFLVCVSPDDEYFFYINSKPSIVGHPGVEISPTELSCLSHQSYIQTTMIIFRSVSLQEARLGYMGTLIPSSAQAIRSAVQQHGQLPGRHERLVLSNF